MYFYNILISFSALTAEEAYDIYQKEKSNIDILLTTSQNLLTTLRDVLEGRLVKGRA